MSDQNVPEQNSSAKEDTTMQTSVGWLLVVISTGFALFFSFPFLAFLGLAGNSPGVLIYALAIIAPPLFGMIAGVKILRSRNKAKIPSKE